MDGHAVTSPAYPREGLGRYFGGGLANSICDSIARLPSVHQLIRGKLRKDAPCTTCHDRVPSSPCWVTSALGIVAFAQVENGASGRREPGLNPKSVERSLVRDSYFESTAYGSSGTRVTGASPEILRRTFGPSGQQIASRTLPDAKKRSLRMNSGSLQIRA